MKAGARARAKVILRRDLSRAGVLAAIWLGISGGDLSSWPFGAAAVAFGTLAAARLSPAPRERLRLLGLARLLPFFIWQSLRGAFDVARRALSPRMPLKPRLYTLRLRLPPGLVKTLYLDAMSLLPGSLGAPLLERERRIQVHLLVATPKNVQRLLMLEERIAAVFGIALGPRPSLAPLDDG